MIQHFLNPNNKKPLFNELYHFFSHVLTQKSGAFPSRSSMTHICPFAQLDNFHHKHVIPQKSVITVSRSFAKYGCCRFCLVGCLQSSSILFEGAIKRGNLFSQVLRLFGTLTVQTCTTLSPEIFFSINNLTLWFCYCFIAFF